MVNNMKKIFAFALIITAAIINFACSCAACTTKEENPISKTVLDKGKEFVTSKTGADFFNAYITPDFTRSAKVEEGYYLVYKLAIPGKNYVDELITFSTDTAGNVNHNMEIHGVPDCLANPEDCSFSVTEENAVNIAVKEGLEKGIKEWNKGIVWNAYYNKYVWHIMTTLAESQNSNGTKSNGKEIIIDASSGKVLEKNNWSVR